MKLIPLGLGKINATAYHVNSQVAICGTDEELVALIDLLDTNPNSIVKISGFKSPIWHAGVDQERAVAYAIAMNGTISRIDLSNKIATHFINQTDFCPRFLKIGRNSPLVVLAGASGLIQFRSRDDLSFIGDELKIECDIRICLWNEQQDILVVGGDCGELFLIQGINSCPVIISLEPGQRMVSGLLPDNDDPNCFLVLFESGRLEKIRYDGTARKRLPIILPSRSYGLVSLSGNRILVDTEKNGPHTIRQDGFIEKLSFHDLLPDFGFYAAAEGKLVISISYGKTVEVWNSESGETVFSLPTTKAPPVCLFSTDDPEIFLVGFENDSLGIVRITTQPEVQRASLAIKTMISAANSKMVMVVTIDGKKIIIDSSLTLNTPADNQNIQLIDITSKQTFYSDENIAVETIHENNGPLIPKRRRVAITRNNIDRKYFPYSIGGGYAISDDYRFIAVSTGSDDMSMSVHSIDNDQFYQTIETDWIAYDDILFSPSGDIIVARACEHIDIFKRQSGHHLLRFIGKCIHDCILEGFLNNETVLVRHESGELLTLRLDIGTAMSVGCIPDYSSHAVFVRNTDYYLIYTITGSFKKVPVYIDGYNSKIKKPINQLRVEVNPITTQPTLLTLYKKVYGINEAYHHGGMMANKPAYLDHWSFELKGEQLDGDGPRIFCSADFPLSPECFVGIGLEIDTLSPRSILPENTARFRIVAHELYHLYQSLTLSSVFKHVRSAQKIQELRLTAAVFLLRSGQTIQKNETLIGWYERICTANIGKNSIQYVGAYFEQFLAFSGEHDREPFLSLVESSAVVFEHVACGKKINLSQIELEFNNTIYTHAIRRYMEAGGKSPLGFLFVAETALHFGNVKYRDRGSTIGIVTPWDIFDFLLENVEHFEADLAQSLTDLHNNWDAATNRCCLWLETIRSAVSGQFSIAGTNELDPKDEDHFLASALNIFNKNIFFASAGIGVLHLLFHRQSRECFVNMVMNDLISGKMNHDYLGEMPHTHLRLLHRSLREHDGYVSGVKKIFCCQAHGYKDRPLISDCLAKDSTYNVLSKFFGKTLEELHHD